MIAACGWPNANQWSFAQRVANGTQNATPKIVAEPPPTELLTQPPRPSNAGSCEGPGKATPRRHHDESSKSSPVESDICSVF